MTAVDLSGDSVTWFIQEREMCTPPCAREVLVWRTTARPDGEGGAVLAARPAGMPGSTTQEGLFEDDLN